MVHFEFLYKFRTNNDRVGADSRLRFHTICTADILACERAIVITCNLIVSLPHPKIPAVQILSNLSLPFAPGQ